MNEFKLKASIKIDRYGNLREPVMGSFIPNRYLLRPWERMAIRDVEYREKIIKERKN